MGVYTRENESERLSVAKSVTMLFCSKLHNSKAIPILLCVLFAPGRVLRHSAKFSTIETSLYRERAREEASGSIFLGPRWSKSQFHVYGTASFFFLFFSFPEHTLHFNEGLARILSAH